MSRPATANLYCSGVQWDQHSVLALLPLIACAGCGLCCSTLHPIRVQGYEARRIAEYLEVPLAELVADWEHLDLLDYSFPSPCPFRSEAGCLVYEARPVVCKYFPLATVERSEGKVVAVGVELCDAGRPVIAQLERWQR